MWSKKCDAVQKMYSFLQDNLQSNRHLGVFGPVILQKVDHFLYSFLQLNDASKWRRLGYPV